MASFLKQKRTIMLDGEPIKVYDYSRSDEQIREDSQDDIVINVENSRVTHNPLKDLMDITRLSDSCYETHVGTPDRQSGAHTPVVWAEEVEEMPAVAPALTRQNTQHDDVRQEAGMNHLQEQLAIISNKQFEQPKPAALGLVSIADQIKLPQNMFDNDTYANLKVQAVMIISNGLMTA